MHAISYPTERDAVNTRLREIQRTSWAADYARDTGDYALAASLEARAAALVSALRGREPGRGVAS